MENFWNKNIDLGKPQKKSENAFHSQYGLDSRYIEPKASVELNERFLKYSSAKKLADEIEINQRSRYFVIINGNFYFGDFIEALLVKNNWHVKKMTISTLSLNENNVDSLANLLNGNYLDELNLIVSDYFYSHERHDLIPYIYQELDKDDKFQLAAAGTHCKLCIFETHCGKFVVIHGSSNLRSSSNIEQIVIEENEELFKFNDEYQDIIIEHFKTIKKSLRGEKLWQAVAADTKTLTMPEKQEKQKREKANLRPPKKDAVRSEIQA